MIEYYDSIFRYKNDNGGIILTYKYVGVSSDKTIWIPKS